MTKVKSANGKIVDFGALARENEQLKAVGNVPMNAKGDRLDSKSNVSATVQRITRLQKNLVSEPVATSVTLTDNPAKVVADHEASIAEKQKQKQPKVVNTRTKKDVTGKNVTEIEYEDGSIEVTREGNQE